MVVLTTACSHPLIPAPTEATALPLSAPGSTRDYKIQQRFTLTNLGSSSPDKQNLWVALIRDVPPYQSAQLVGITPVNYQLAIDEYGNQYAEFDLSNHPAGTDIAVILEYRVTVYGQWFDLGDCQGDMIQEYIQPELHIESANPQITELSKALSKGTHNPCKQARVFYDYAAEELIYTYNRDNWGAQAALGEMGADCSEYTDLMMALSRSAGIPARYYEGLLYVENKENEIPQIEHAWLDVYLPGAGWVPMDPTLGRSRLHRETHFAQYTPDHIIITTGRNPSTLRGSSYWSHLYWPGNRTQILLEGADWLIEPVNPP